MNGEPFERTLVRFANERLLYRLGASAVRERCLLKGASLLSVWLPDPHRATRDVDVLATGPAEDADIRMLVSGICSVPCPEDALRFDLSALEIHTIRTEEQYPGKRARFLAFLGTARIAVQLDIAIGDAVPVEPQEIAYPTLLSALPPPRLRAYPRELTVAEKFEAMVTLGTRNSRMKDFHDVWALCETFSFDGATLLRAINACFERRGTPWGDAAPGVLTPAFYRAPEMEARWRGYLSGGAVLVPPPARFDAIGERIVAFLGPTREWRLSAEGSAGVWSPGGPWRMRPPSDSR